MISNCRLCNEVWNLLSSCTSTCNPPSGLGCPHTTTTTANYPIFWITSELYPSPAERSSDLLCNRQRISQPPVILERHSETENFLVISAWTTAVHSNGHEESILDMLQGLRNTDKATVNYLVVYEPILTDGGLFCLKVHLLKDLVSGFTCLAEFIIPDWLDEYLQLVGMISRRIFINNDDIKRHNQLAACIFCGTATRNPIGLPYFTQLFAFSFPNPEWTAYWPWSPNSNLQSLCKGDISQLLLSSPNCAQIKKFNMLFWRYFVVFLVDCLARNNCCPQMDAFGNFKLELETSQQELEVFTNCEGENLLVCFLNGLYDTSDFHNPLVHEILEKHLLPLNSPGDFTEITENDMFDLGARVMQEPTMCELISQFDPDFILCLIENRTLQIENFRSLHLLAGHSGDNVISDWLRFIFPIYWDCLMQVGLSGREYEVRERFIKVFQDPTISSPLIDFELQNYLPKIGLLSTSMQYRAKAAARCALRKQLKAMSPPRISIKSFINQLSLPRWLHAFLAKPAV